MKIRLLLLSILFFLQYGHAQKVVEYDNYIFTEPVNSDRSEFPNSIRYVIVEQSLPYNSLSIQIYSKRERLGSRDEELQTFYKKVVRDPLKDISPMHEPAKIPSIQTFQSLGAKSIGYQGENKYYVDMYIFRKGGMGKEGESYWVEITRSNDPELFKDVELNFWKSLSLKGNSVQIFESDSKVEREINPDSFLIEAVRLELERVNMSAALKNKLDQPGDPNYLFVPKCPICRATQKAISDYKAPENDYGRGNITKEEWEAYQKLDSDDKERMLEGLKELVNISVERHAENLMLSQSEKQSLDEKLKKMREKGMQFKGDRKFCGSCDGACGIQ